MHSADGAPSVAERGNKIDCALIGTLNAPRITVLLLRLRQSQGAMNAMAARRLAIIEPAHYHANLHSLTRQANAKSGRPIDCVAKKITVERNSDEDRTSRDRTAYEQGSDPRR